VNDLLQKTLEQSLLAAADHINKQQSKLRLLAELILKTHAGDDWITQYSDNPGVCVCEGCQLAREIMEVGNE